MDNKTIDLLETAIKKREPLKQCTNALRLVNGLGDGLKGLVLEQYNQHFAAQIFDKRWLKEKEALVNFLKQHFNCQYLIIKDRSESVSSVPDAFKASVWIENDSSQAIVQENGLKFSVDLNDTLNSGLFLDMRRNRRVVSQFANGRKVLNCFSYTCSFGVYCRVAKASGVVNVDISKKSLVRGRLNYELNQLAPAKDEFIPGDCLRYLERAVKKDNRFGLIILDPPSFARYEGKTFSVKKDLAHLVELALKVIEPDGIIFVATNFSGLTHNNLLDMITAGAGKRKIKRKEFLGQDADFIGSGSMPESYLAALLVEL
jgi:23S rRNA (cytosine1962-C5)-methyltransferase